MTRMWQIDPGLLCRQHLLAEHRECHMLAGAVLKGMRPSLYGLALKGRIEVHNVEARHKELEEELHRRGYVTTQPWPDLAGKLWVCGVVNPNVSLVTLYCRCPECAKRIGSTAAKSAVTKLTAAELQDIRDLEDWRAGHPRKF